MEEIFSLATDFTGLLEYLNYNAPLILNGRKPSDMLWSGREKYIELARTRKC